MRNLLGNNSGATAIEYVMLAAIFAIICIVAFSSLSQENSRLFDAVGSAVGSANSQGL